MSFKKIELSMLFIDDDKGVREEFAEFLKLITTKDVYTAEDGLDGIEKYKQYRPDLVLTDFDMPKMDGVKMIEKLKEIEPDIKFCFVTAATQLENQSCFAMQALSPEALYFKPVDMMKFARDLRTIEGNIRKD